MTLIYTINDYRNPSKEINNLKTGPRQLKLIDAKPFTQQAVVNAYWVPASFQRIEQ